MACWELGIQLKRDWLPEAEKAKIKLLVAAGLLLWSFGFRV